MRVRLLVLVAGYALTAVGLGQKPSTPLPAPRDPTLQELAPGHFALGTARIESATHTVTFPAEINMESGALEYLLVSPRGPAHESLLVSDFAPKDLHVAMLLIGAKGAPAPGASETAAGPITAESLRHAPPLQGDRVLIDVTVTNAAGAETTTPVEDWLIYGKTEKPPVRGPWLYTGSFFGANSGRFLAEVEGVHAALVTNPSALINNPRPGHDSDQVWSVNTGVVPKVGTPVRVTLRLLGKPVHTGK